MGIFDFLKRKPAPAAAPTPARNELDPREVLFREVEAVLRADPRVKSVTRLPDQFGLAVDRGGENVHHTFLNNLFAETRELSPEERRKRILYFLSSLGDRHEETWDEVQPLLRLVLRPCTANAIFTPDGELNLPMGRGAMPNLSTLVVVDRPTSMAYVSEKLVEGWETTVDEVFAAAAKNLDAFQGELELYDRRHGPLFTLPGNDDYAASRLLVPGWLASFRGKVEGRPLAIIPERSTLFVGGDQNVELVQWLTETAQREFEKANRSISPAVYTVDDAGQVVPYQRAGADALAHLVRRGHAILSAREYAEQKAVLDQYHQKQDLDLFVATATLMLRKDGRPFSYCVWPDGIDALLPRTDLVVVMGGEPNTPSAWSHTVPFARAQEIGGAQFKLLPPPFGPERFAVNGPFSDAQRAAFAAAVIEPEALP